MEDRLNSSDPLDREKAVRELVLSNATVSSDLLVALLRDPAPAVRCEVLRALMHLKGEGAAPIVALGLQDAAVDVREQAVRTLGNLRSEEARRALVGAFRDPEAQVRRMALWSLRSLQGYESRAALLLQDVDRGVRIAALQKLVKAGPCAREIQQLLNDPDQEIRMLAGKALKAMAPRLDAQPAWLRRNPWKAMQTGTFLFDDPLARPPHNRQRHSLSVSSSVPIHVPSGELIATSVVTDLASTGPCGGYVTIPRGTYRTAFTLDAYEKRTQEGKAYGGVEAAYFSLLLSENAEVRRDVLFRVSEEPPQETGLFFVNKHLLVLADRREVLDAFQHADFEEWSTRILGTLDTSRPLQSLDLPFGKGELHCVRAPNGVAAVVAGYDEAGSLTAIHFDWFVIGSTGEDGEFEKE
jgi:hypothetical protein